MATNRGGANRLEASGEWEIFTKSDSTNFRKTSIAIYVVTGGDIALVQEDDTVVVLPSVPGSWFRLDFAAKRINSTSTTASGFIIAY